MAPEENWWRDTFGPLIALGRLLWGALPKNLKPRRPRFNFILTHYCYIVGWTILGSILLYPVKNMEYIDSLFFAAGMSTQSGLNTIDINLLPTYQQVVFMLTACVTNPIFINTGVVFVRLYWFEKRFTHIIQEARLKRTRTRELSRSRSQMTGEHEDDVVDPSRLEMGITGRIRKSLSFNVRPNSSSNRAEGNQVGDNQRTITDKDTLNPVETSISSSPEGSQNGKEKDGSERTLTEAAMPRPQNESQPMAPGPDSSMIPTALNSRALDRQITFADEVPKEGRQSPELSRVPDQQDISKHIAFIERQQANAKTGGALRIPGPRDFEGGAKPEQVNDDDRLSRLNTKTSNPDGIRDNTLDSPNPSRGEHPVKRGITINEPDHPGHRSRNVDDEAAASARPETGKSSVFRRRSSKALNLNEGPRSFSKTWTNLTGPRTEDPMPYFEWTATTGRNSTFVGLTQDQREELGGLEYCALKTLATILICYFVGFHVLGMVVLLPWILYSATYREYVESVGQSAAWWGVFTPASMFNDLGFTLTPDSMISFQKAILPLLFGSFLIVIGNTGFPCMLRFIIWVLSKCFTKGTDTYNELRFLLDHPRRCFTLLFPSKATWWLFWVLVGLNVVDLVFFVILDLNEAAVTDIPSGFRVLNGWFQAVSTRTAGFSSVNLAQLHAAIQVSYMIMMYISVFPVAISVRRTNVYEEKSLGIFGGEEDAGGDEGEQSYVSQHLRRQLSFDLWFIFLGLFIIAIVEGDRLSNTNEYAFTLFSVLFEIVSAYGTVGLSLGYPNINASFSTEFRTISKLIVIAMMIRGRHRGLPYALDRAILLPSEKLHQKEAEEDDIQLHRRQSIFAEGEDNLDRQTIWSDGDLDQYGLPIQHTGYQGLHDHAMTAGAGGEPDPESLRKLHTRRSTIMSNKSRTGGTSKEQKRKASLSRVLASGLSAGPTLSKHD